MVSNRKNIYSLSQGIELEKYWIIYTDIRIIKS